MAFDLQSPGAAFGDAFTQSLIQQDQLKRQKLLDELSKRDKESIISNRQQQTDIERMNAESLGNYRQSQNLDDIARAHQIDAANAQATKDAAAENAFGMYLDQNPNATDSDMRKFLVQAGMSMAKVNQTVTGAANIARDKARLAQQDELAKQADQTRRDLADQGHQDRMAISGMTAANQNARTQDKKDAQVQADQRAAGGVLDQVDSIDNTLKQLMSKDKAGQDVLSPGVGSIVGGMRVPGFISRNFGNIPGMDNADKQASLDRLSSQMIVGLITEMKSASKTGATGFGQLSDKEGAILERASAQLSQAQSEPAFLKALQQVRDSINRIRVHAQDRMKAGAQDQMNSGVTIEPGPKKPSRYFRIQSSIEN